MDNQIKHPGGRPPFYKTAEELQSKIDEYFLTGVKKITVIVKKGGISTAVDIPTPTITGLVLYCGFCDRRSFYDLELKDEFTHTIKTARSRIEMEYEQDLKHGLGAGAIFALKNFGWKDNQGLELSGLDNGAIPVSLTIKSVEPLPKDECQAQT